MPTSLILKQNQNFGAQQAKHRIATKIILWWKSELQGNVQLS